MLLTILIIAGVMLVFYRIFAREIQKLIIVNVNLAGKVVVVTGASAGIGFCVAKDLARRGARVILACRSEERGAAARDRIVAETGNRDVALKQLDLASLASVRRFCEDIRNTERRLDVLVNNAGVFGLGDQYSEDGIVLGMQINHFAPFLLTELLLPLIKQSKPSRIVNVSSPAHYLGFVSVERINQKCHNDFMTYSNSKLCNMAYTMELAYRLRGYQVSVNAVDPGVLKTDNAGLGKKNNLNFMFYMVYNVLSRTLSRSVEEAAAQVVWACVDPGPGILTGRFLVDGGIWLYSWRCYNKKNRQKLWQATEELVNSKSNENIRHVVAKNN